MYSIYCITSPSGKAYIGLTGSKITERWRQHVKRAYCEYRNHPFYNAVRKYGPDNFSIILLDSANTKQEAQRLEMFHIANHDPDKLYNLSPGGEADGEFGAMKFWGDINKDPERKEAYIKKLSETKLKNDWTNYPQLSEKAKEWRSNNPKKAYKLSRRAIRIANKAQQEKLAKIVKIERDRKDFLRWKYDRSKATHLSVTQVWANRTEEEKALIFKKSSDSHKANWSKITDPNERSKKTQAARNAIDREKQGPAASKGIKNFWAELKADPERYRAYIEARTASLMKTLEVKKHESL